MVKIKVSDLWDLPEFFREILKEDKKFMLFNQKNKIRLTSIIISKMNSKLMIFLSIWLRIFKELNLFPPEMFQLQEDQKIFYLKPEQSVLFLNVNKKKLKKLNLFLNIINLEMLFWILFYYYNKSLKIK